MNPREEFYYKQLESWNNNLKREITCYFGINLQDRQP